MKSLLLALFIGVFSFLSKAQEKIWIHGIVLSAKDNKELVGATIQNRRAGNQVASSLQGRFSIQIVNVQDSLLISCMGYMDRIVEAAFFKKNNIIGLQPKVNYLEEAVVNTGYQTLKANEVTGAIDVVDNKMLNQQVGTNILQRLNNMTTAVRFDNQPIQNADLQKLNISVREPGSAHSTGWFYI
ncbi:MAG: carboxypeptidase-like regulatory domain-containing protein [Sphingobacterium siyangense]